MTPADLLNTVVRPSLEAMPEKYRGQWPEIMLLAISAQETQDQFEDQIGGGPGRGLWSFESESVADVLERCHDAAIALEALGVPAIPAVAYDALDHNNFAACVLARGKLYLDPRPLPQDPQTAWTYYDRLWDPGEPRPNRWDTNWKTAYLTVMGVPYV